MIRPSSTHPTHRFHITHSSKYILLYQHLIEKVKLNFYQYTYPILTFIKVTYVLKYKKKQKKNLIIETYKIRLRF